MKTVFDIGMYDGSDTAYYLECGFKVVSVEANPELVQAAQRRFAAQISSGRLTCVHAAISHSSDDVDLFLCGNDLGSSSLFNDRVTHDRRVTVPGVTMGHLFSQHGLPDYLKVDIEGADRLCVLALTEQNRPPYLSFEVGNDADELLSHIAAIGFQRFKLIQQDDFRELANQNCLYDRITNRVVRFLGYKNPQLIRRAGRFFVSGHSSGPVPWKSDGRWWSAEETRSRLIEAKRTGRLSGWYDVHAN